MSDTTKLFLAAIGEVHYLENGKKKIAEPDTLFVIDAATGEKLKDMKAARVPSEAEIALYEKQNGAPDLGEAEAAKSARQAAVKKAAAAKKDPADKETGDKQTADAKKAADDSKPADGKREDAPV